MARSDLLAEVLRQFHQRTGAGADGDADAADRIGIAGGGLPRHAPAVAVRLELLRLDVAGLACPFVDDDEFLHDDPPYFCATSILICFTAASTFSSRPFLP